MATQKSATGKPVTKAAKQAVRKGTTKKPAAGTGVKKGTKYACDVCGLVVSVDTLCGCEKIDLLCCNEPMTAKK